MNRAGRRLCAKAKHPWMKRMEDGTLRCVNCGYVPPEENQT